jgi:glycosyltransferase involved in cell wall biosynthesis
MNPFRKTKVVIASTLKPVDDVRLYEKMATTLSDSGQYECHLIGSQGHTRYDITSFSFKDAKRISFARLSRPIVAARTIFRLRPDILIIATHELLFAAALYKIVTGNTVIYDIQENYYLNIRYTNVFPRLFRRPLAAWVRLKEKLFSRFIDSFLLAEKGYLNELAFVNKRAVVLENKAIVPPGFARRPVEGVIELLFSGTIDDSTGIHEAISLARSLHASDARFRLHIIGYCSRPSILESVRAATHPLPFIRITGGDAPVPHGEIMKAVAQAHFGLICYRPSPHINNRMPTKLYEYMACRLPILVRKDLWWCDLVEKAQAGIGINVTSPIQPDLLLRMSQSTYYPGGGRNISFEFDKTRLLETFERLVVRG